jgi:hypothetical protein
MMKLMVDLGVVDKGQWYWLSPTTNWAVLFENDKVKYLGVIKD